MKILEFVLDNARHEPRMRAPMHPNYRKPHASSGAAALPQGTILSNRSGVTACARPDARESDVLMR